MAYRRKPPPEQENVFVRRHVEKMVGAGKPPKLDPDRLSKGGSKPSPARSASAGRANAMEIRASIRKHEAFIAKKELQRQRKREVQDGQ